MIAEATLPRRYAASHDEDGPVDVHAVAIEGPLDLRSTLRPLHGRFAEDGWWLTARTPDGPATLHVARSRDEVHGRAWGKGGGWLLDRLGAITGLDDDPALFVTDDPIVSEVHRTHPGRRFGRTDLVFDSLLVAICGQKVTGREAIAAMRGLYRRFGDPAPGPFEQLRLPPHPERMAVTGYHEFHPLHLERRRAELIRAVSARANEIDALSESSPSQAAVFLQTFNGVAEWTSAKTLAVSHGDPDQVAVGDFHYKHIVVHHLTGRDRGTDEEMLDLLEPFRPHRGRVIRLLHILGHEPSFGPRLSPRDITRM